MTTTDSDPRSIDLGVDRWLTDTRAYNLLWLGRWLERAYEIARELLHLAQRDAEEGGSVDAATMLEWAASARGMTVAEGSTALEALLTERNGASVRAWSGTGALQRDGRGTGRADPESGGRDRAV